MKQEFKEKKVGLEIIRILACMFVIFNHTCSSYMLGLAPMNTTRVLLTLTFFLCKTAVPMFLMVSGACLLGKTEPAGKTAGRIIRMLLVLVGMSVVYNLLREEPAGFVDFFKEFFCNPVTNSYWYMYMYIGILLLLPILRKLQLKKEDYLYLTILYVIMQGTWPVLGYYFQWIQPAQEWSIALFSTYIYCFLMGQYFVKVENGHTRKGVIGASLGLVVSLGISFMLSFIENAKTGMALFDVIYEKEIYVLTMITTFSLFYLVRYVGSKIKSGWGKKLLIYVGGCTFVIYLLSDIFIYSVPWIEWQGNYFVGVVLRDIWVFLAGLLVASVLRFIPGIRKLLFT